MKISPTPIKEKKKILKELKKLNQTMGIYAACRKLKVNYHTIRNWKKELEPEKLDS